MLLQSHFPEDERVERQIRTLSSHGFNVAILCNQYKKTDTRKMDNCEIYRIRALFNSLWLNRILNFPLFLNPRFIYYTFLAYYKFHPNVIHVHDLPMAPLGILLSKLFKIPLVLDLHENYPEALREFKKKGILNFLFKNPNLAKKLEQYSLKASHKIVVVVDEHKEKLIADNVNPEKITVLQNTIDIETFGATPINAKIVEKYKNNFVISYIGKVSIERGLEIPIKALQKIVRQIDNVILLIIGDGPSILDFKTYASKVGVENNIEFIAWPKLEKINSYLEVSNICIYPQPRNKFSDCGLPNKLFEYMYWERPVLVGDVLPIKRIVEETNCGLVFRSNDTKDFIEKIMGLKKSIVDFGANGRLAVLKKYNWEKDAQKLLELYSKVFL